MKNNTIEEKIDNIGIFINLFKRLLKIMIFHKKNKISFNKLLLLANKEYFVETNFRRTLNSFEKIASEDIHKKISLNYKLYKDKKTFKAKVKRVKSLLFWIGKLDETKIIRTYPKFVNDLNNDLELLFKERLTSLQNKDGQIEEDMRFLEDSPQLYHLYQQVKHGK